MTRRANTNAMKPREGLRMLDLFAFGVVGYSLWKLRDRTSDTTPDVVDIASRDSFPASDPPSFNGGREPRQPAVQAQMQGGLP